jgi:hypothetical protein
MGHIERPNHRLGLREMESNITDAANHEVHVVETDQRAVSATVRRLELFTGATSAVCLGIAIYAFCIYAPLTHSTLFYKVVMALIGIYFILLVLLHFIGPLCLRKMDVLIGNDFIAGPETFDLVSFFMRMAGHKTILDYDDLDYDDIVGVNLDISKGRITGATVIGKSRAMTLVRRVTEPQTVIRAIREHTGSEVRWRRSPPRFTRLSGDEVDSLINKGEKKNFDEQQRQLILD